MVGNSDFVAQARAAQQRALVLPENKHHLLPLKDAQPKVWVFVFYPAAVTKYGFIDVDSPDGADFAIIRADSPSKSQDIVPFAKPAAKRAAGESLPELSKSVREK